MHRRDDAERKVRNHTMRDQKRSFVVEYKSRARANKVAKPRSIWGDTDLRAVARQVEEETLQLQAPIDKLAIAAAPQAPNTETSTASSALVENMPTGAHHVPEEVTVTAQIRPNAEPGASPSIFGETLQDTSILPRRKARRAPRVRPKFPSITEVTSTREFNQAEIAGLLNENARLKALLRLRLEADNKRLKVMLARFPN
jgi:hypothetical protein